MVVLVIHDFICGREISLDNRKKYLYIIAIRGLNRKQREFLFDILGKVIVYISTVVIVRRLIGKSFDGITLGITILVLSILTIFSPYLLKGGE